VTIPNYQQVMEPLMRLSADEAEHTVREAVEVLSQVFGLEDSEVAELLSSGTPVFASRVGWAATYLRKAGLLESTRRGYFRITARGKLALAEGGAEINTEYLRRYPEFVAFQSRKSGDDSRSLTTVSADERQTPEDAIEAAYQSLRTELAEELIQQIMSCSPVFFERLVVDLLVRMGYGGTRKDAGQAIGKSGDGGIDGIINEDRLGLDVVYIQAKRWEGTVGRPEIQRFVGALQGQRARKGIFITTSSFSAEAREYAAFVDTKVVLIDGESLATFMMDAGVGVASVATYDLKRVDLDYFVNG
jgi:restriction system protein